MTITVYKLGDIIIYPVSRQKTNMEPLEASTEWFVLPGRKVIHARDLYTLAKRLGLSLSKTKISYPSLDWGRRH